MKGFRIYCSMAFLALSCAGGAQAATISYADLWDVSQGAVVTATSGALAGGWSSDARNMFGGTFGSGPGDVTNNTIFKDYQAAGYVHRVEWKTAAPITLGSFNLVASHDAGSDGYVTRDINYRGFSAFTLFVGDGIGGWTSLYSYAADPDNDKDYGGGPNYPAQNMLELYVDVADIVAQYFKAEFVQYGPYPRTSPGYADSQGPRILELDAYGPASVPEPATLALFGLGLAGIGAVRRRRTVN